MYNLHWAQVAIPLAAVVVLYAVAKYRASHRKNTPNDDTPTKPNPKGNKD